MIQHVNNSISSITKETKTNVTAPSYGTQFERMTMGSSKYIRSKHIATFLVQSSNMNLRCGTQADQCHLVEDINPTTY
jgi:hypothetical protein